MSQSFFNALLMGPKETPAAKKVIKFVAYYGFITIALGTAILFIPFEPLQNALNESMPNKWPLVGAALFSIICLVFLLKEKFWAPCLLIAVTLGDMIITYMETKSIPGSFGSITLILYLSAAQATYFLMKQKKNETLETQTQES